MRKSGDSVDLPKILGFEAAGVVEKLGPGTTGFEVGDRVALTQFDIGTYLY